MFEDFFSNGIDVLELGFSSHKGIPTPGPKSFWLLTAKIQQLSGILIAITIFFYPWCVYPFHFAGW
jgi:hypothetical protein